MRLESGNQSVELRPLGYQFPGAAASGEHWDWDANWLQVAGVVRDGDLAWSFQDPCLTTRDARELLEWLRGVANGDVRPDGRSGGDTLSFIEPNVHFALRDRTDAGASIVAFFSQESSPPGSEEEIRYGEGYEVVLVLTLEAIGRAADDWQLELMAFPER